MNPKNTHQIDTAEVVLPCSGLDATVVFFTERLGFRIEAIFPADHPSIAVLSGYGLRIRLAGVSRMTLPDNGSEAALAPGVLRLYCRDPAALADGASELIAPNGTRVQLIAADPPLFVPPLVPSLVLSQLSDRADWSTGRAGMRYRDLIPDRQGGRFIASHIHIPDGGPVPDYVHFHRVRFQMIYCYKGWVRVVYQDQGPPFVLQAGDCVLQPPQIRHRVLESSPGLEVIEIGCPAEHETVADHDLPLPTPALRPQRQFAGQRFVRHVAAAATWRPWRIAGFEGRDTGIAAATDGLADVCVVRPATTATATRSPQWSHNAELLFLFALAGTVTLHCQGHGTVRLNAADSLVVPAGLNCAIAESSDDLELLEVTLNAVLGGRLTGPAPIRSSR
ncbi:MAG: cupin domain-containing protein [Proteobacteria bacterium]|nr:cupin domain-containing protein [Pseudomonadota bacterium]